VGIYPSNTWSSQQRKISDPRDEEKEKPFWMPGSNKVFRKINSIPCLGGAQGTLSMTKEISSPPISKHQSLILSGMKLKDPVWKISFSIPIFIFDKKWLFGFHVWLNEASGDFTRLIFSGKKLNGPIADEKFRTQCYLLIPCCCSQQLVTTKSAIDKEIKTCNKVGLSHLCYNFIKALFQGDLGYIAQPYNRIKFFKQTSDTYSGSIFTNEMGMNLLRWSFRGTFFIHNCFPIFSKNLAQDSWKPDSGFFCRKTFRRIQSHLKRKTRKQWIYCEIKAGKYFYWIENNTREKFNRFSFREAYTKKTRSSFQWREDIPGKIDVNPMIKLTMNSLTW